MKIGDTVHTESGRLYIIRSFFESKQFGGPAARLQPLQPGPGRRHSKSAVSTLTLVRSRELSLAFSYAAESEREASEDWQRARARQYAAHWLTRAEERNDDSRAALCLGSDRILELEAAS